MEDDEDKEDAGFGVGDMGGEVEEGEGAEAAPLLLLLVSALLSQHPSITPAAVGQQRPSRWRAAQAGFAAHEDDEDEDDDGADALKNGTEDISLATVLVVALSDGSVD